MRREHHVDDQAAVPAPPAPAMRSAFPSSMCPLCGSSEGRVLIETDAILFVECSRCAGHDLHFWVTRQASERADWMRRGGHMVDPSRTRGLIAARRDRGGSALLRPADVDDIVGH